MPSWAIATITAAVTLVIGKLLDDWLKRQEEKRRSGREAREASLSARKDQREEEAQELNAAKYWQEDAQVLREQIAQLRHDFDSERTELKLQIDELGATNARQAQEILTLTRQIYLLQRDRDRKNRAELRKSRGATTTSTPPHETEAP